jgi:hypothetical protein
LERRKRWGVRREVKNERDGRVLESERKMKMGKRKERKRGNESESEG